MIDAVSTARQPACMVWGAIWLCRGGRIRRSPLVIMTRDTSARRHGYSSTSYIQALEEGLLPNYRVRQRFMQDNAPIHTLRVSRNWLQVHQINTINWPPYSPDLNPIEHLWWALKREAYRRNPNIDSINTTESWAEFEACLKAAWVAIPNTLIYTLITSMPRRIEACRLARGYQTKY